MSQADEFMEKNENENENQDKLVETESQNFWLKEFSGEIVRSTFHYDYKETVSNVRIIDSVDFRFSGEVFSNLIKLTNRSDVKLYTILTSSLVTLLSRHSFSQTGFKDIIVGAPVLYQQRKGVEIKPINTVLALRNKFEENVKFTELTSMVETVLENAQAHKDFAVEDLPELLKMKVFGDDFPLFDVAISLENIQDRRYMRHLNVNMIFSFFRTDKYLDGVVEYNSSLYERRTIKKIIAHFTNLMQLVLSGTNDKLGIAELDILSDEEKKELLYDFGGGEASYPNEKNVHLLFEENVRKLPNKIALVFENTQLSYLELNHRSNKIGWFLRKNGVVNDSVIPMMIERSLDAIVSIMGIIKSGAGYLPIVVDNPVDRIRTILNDIESKFVITREKYLNLLNNKIKALYIEDVLSMDLDAKNPPVINFPESLMYVIYTSGSTGKPKGVMLDQDNFVNLMFFQYMETKIDFKSRILQFASIGFDVSAQEIFSTLLGCGTLFLTSDEMKHDALRLFKYIQKNLVSVLFMPPAFLKFVFSDSGITEKFPNSIKHIIAAGEQLIVTDGFEKYLKKNGTYLHNHYGPTESHVVTTLTLSPKKGIPEAPSIGRPITNNNILILGRDSKVLQPLGIPGELYISGKNVARGYSNRPELTHDRFMNNPYLEKERMYRTGDLARWFSDGNIDYLGRIDFQVKIRGFRIEIGEIESQLLKYEEAKLREVVVLAREEKKGAEKYLCAYIVSDKKVNFNNISNFLLKNLPDYMVPSYFVQVDKIPLTSNGKVDRRALPDPKSLGRQESYIAPRNEIENTLLKIWADVLHMDRDNISIDDNFFKLGGHSLKAALMIANIHKELNVKISIYDIFEIPTIMELAHHIDGTVEEEFTSIELEEEKEYYQQTSAQKRLYFIDQLENGSILYNIQLMDIYCKGVDRDSIEKAFKALIQRHESLRTSFHTIDGQAIQRIHDYKKIESDFKIEYYETTEEGLIYDTEPHSNGKGVPFMEVVEGFVRPFNLKKAPLIRVGLIKIWGNTQILMMDMHHIISDGISLEVLLSDLWALYDEAELPALRVQYKDFSVWLNGDKQRNIIMQQEKYWLQEFSEEVPVLNLPVDFQRPAKMTFDGDSIYFEIGREETKKLYEIGQEQSTTLYMIILAVFNILLSKISGQEEVVVGTVSAGRSHADLHQLIGMFVETLAIRNKPKGNKTFYEFLGEVKNKTLSAFSNQNYPFEQLVSKVSTRQDKSRNPLFDVVFSYENEAERSDEYLLDVLMLDKTNPFNFKIKKAKFDMTLIGAETGKEIQFTFEYNTQLFKVETIDRLIIYFKKIITSVCNNPMQSLSQIDIMPDLERGILLYAFNDTEFDYPKDKTFNILLEEQAEKNPEFIAVIDDNMVNKSLELKKSLTYGELNAKVNQLSTSLRNKAVKSDQVVSIMVEPSLEMFIGLLGILKAGGAFLPIKDGTPRERIEYILYESGTSFLLTRTTLLQDIVFDGEIIELDQSTSYNQSIENPIHNNVPQDLAYVIYTSGSTGKPKGVMINHRTLINLCYWHNDYYSVSSNDHASKFAGFGFDASVWEIFPYLIVGAAIYIVPEEIKLDIHALNKYFHENQISISFLPTQICEQFMTIENNSLRILLAGGDKLKSFVRKNYKLFNNYGPTENTVVTTSFHVTNFDTNIPIGKPVYNNQIYIMDKNNNLQPIGVPGELCIGGESLARGYLNNPVLSNEKFIDSPFKHLTPWALFPRLYRTGDLARWLTDGNIEFLGRIDYQVKIRGFRIELGEIENQLLHLEQVKETVVIARDDSAGQKYLCAYIVPAKTLEILELKKEIAKSLPDYMVPSFFIQIENIPLTPNGKIDTKALPEPKVKSVEYIAPTNEVEEVLANTWKDVLGIEKIGIDDNFFEIGGDSIKTILISGRLLKQKLSADVNDFFLYPTIRQLAIHIKKVERIIDQSSVMGKVELTPIIAWFFEQKFIEKNHFNHYVIWFNKDGFDLEIVKNTFARIIEHHDALRMIYKYENKTYRIIQENRDINEGILYNLEIFSWHDKLNFKKDMEEEIDRINRNINLETGPLVNLAIFKTNAGDYLTVIIHHLIIDGVSWRIIAEDFKEGYSLLLKGNEFKMQDKTDSFKEWAYQQKKIANSSTILKELPYWLTIENSKIEKLPRDKIIDIEMKTLKNRDLVSINLNRNETEMLQKEVNFAYNTEINDILLTALALAVKRWGGLEKILVNLEGHGRERIIEDIDISRTIGWFTSQYPILLDVSELISQDDQIGSEIRKIKESLRRIPNKGIGYGILKHLTSSKNKNNIDFKLKPEISFNYLGYLGENESSEQLDLNINTNFEPSMSPEFNVEYAFDIYGSIGNDGLKLFFSYNKLEYNKKTAETFANYYKDCLLEIILHCQQKKNEMIALGKSSVEYHLNKDIGDYFTRINNEFWPDLSVENEYKSILLTGATGFLGAHLLSELLQNSNATLYLLIRGKTQEDAQERFQKKMSYYFGGEFFSTYSDRINVVKSDLSKPYLDIQEEQFKHLSEAVEVVIHPAANVKHHGLYEELYKDNVLATEHLLEFALSGGKKDFHYVSTLDVGLGNIPGKEYVLYTEFCHDLGQDIDHIYLKSKFEAEKRVLNYRSKGLDASIHRVGNLIFHSTSGRFQENIGDDYFYAILKGMVKLKMLSDDLSEIAFDMSFIDFTAKAILLLMRKNALKNQTYHLCNPNELQMITMVRYLKELGFEINKISQQDIENYLAQYEGNSEFEKIIELMKVHSWIFEKREGTQTVFKMDRTVNLLKKLGFQWPEINKQHIEKMIAHCKEVGFI